MKLAVLAALMLSACASPTPSEGIADLAVRDAARGSDSGSGSPDAKIPLQTSDLAGVDLAEAAPSDMAVDYCGKAQGGCSPHATCTQTGTTPSCACNTGYTGDGLTCSLPATAQINEGFDDITTLTGWTQQNSSTPVGALGWFQGNDVNFDAFDGATTSCISADYSDTGDGGTISNWLTTPTITFGALASVAFYTRKDAPDVYPDRIEVRLCTKLPCAAPTDTGVGDFTTVLTTVDPNLVTGSYPVEWTQLAFDNTTLPWSGQGRVAIRYYVTNSGSGGANGDVIGIDRFTAGAGSAAYAVRGSVTGLSGTVTLKLNSFVSLAVTTSSFDFGKHLDSGTPYVVTVGTQPSGQTCTVASGSGTIAAADIATVAVSCK